MKYVLLDDLDWLLEDDDLDLMPSQQERLCKLLRNAIRDTADFDSLLVRNQATLPSAGPSGPPRRWPSPTS